MFQGTDLAPWKCLFHRNGWGNWCHECDSHSRHICQTNDCARNNWAMVSPGSGFCLAASKNCSNLVLNLCDLKISFRILLRDFWPVSGFILKWKQLLWSSSLVHIKRGSVPHIAQGMDLKNSFFMNMEFLFLWFPCKYWLTLCSAKNLQNY